MVLSWHDMCGMNLNGHNFWVICAVLRSHFFWHLLPAADVFLVSIFCTAIQIWPPSISLHGQVLYTNYGTPFSYFWDLPSYLYWSYYDKNSLCMSLYTKSQSKTPWTSHLSLENTRDTRMNFPLFMIIKKAETLIVHMCVIHASSNPNFCFVLTSWYIPL